MLEENFSKAEEHLYHSAVKHYQQNNKELFYDITSSYFEGHKCIIAKYGYSRDHRKIVNKLSLVWLRLQMDFQLNAIFILETPRINQQ